MLYTLSDPTVRRWLITNRFLHRRERRTEEDRLTAAAVQLDLFQSVVCFYPTVLFTYVRMDVDGSAVVISYGERRYFINVYCTTDHF